MSDLISRSALLERMEKVLFATVPVEHQLYVQMAIDAFKAVAENAPAVDAEPVRRGEWRPYKQTVECSVCLVKWAVDESVALVYTATKDLKFCPNCGAYMRGGKDATD